MLLRDARADAVPFCYSSLTVKERIMGATWELKKVARALAVAGALSLPVVAHAEPDLQIYIEGATYDTLSETWVFNSTDPVRLWVLGIATITDVKLAIAYSDLLSPTFSLTGTTTGGYLGYTDPSVASDPTLTKTVTDGSSPVKGDGTSLPSHGIYGDNTDWTEFLLGDFNLTDSEICDFSITAPTAASCTGKPGQINVYEFSVSGVDEGSLFHFDTYNHTIVGNDNLKYVFAPFSHDGEATSSSSSGGGGASTSGPVPEPGTLSLLGAALLGGVFQYRYRRRSRK